MLTKNFPHRIKERQKVAVDTMNRLLPKYRQNTGNKELDGSICDISQKQERYKNLVEKMEQTLANTLKKM